MNGFTQIKMHILLALSLFVWAVSPPQRAAAGELPPLPQPVAATLAGLPALAPEYSNCTAQTAPVLNGVYEQRIVDLVNSERASAGLPPLKMQTGLMQAARYHGADLGQDNYFQHDSYDRPSGTLTFVCAWSTRIAGFYSGWAWLGENIAAGAGTPEGAMSLWMNSPGHRANILNSGYWEIGAGYYTGSGSYSAYWVQDFGRRSNIYPLVINRDAATATSRDVSLYLYGSWSEMRLRNDSGAWSAWQPFANSSNWQLPASDGSHTVSAEMRTGTQTASANDAISLDLPAAPEIGSLPESITFFYNLPDQKLLPAAIVLTPENVGSADSLEWQVLGGAEWVNLSQNQGATPQSFTVSPATTNLETVSTLTTTLTVQVLSPQSVLGSPFEIDITLHVIDTHWQSVFLPVIVH